jgi:protoporphyrinogen oxidase
MSSQNSTLEFESPPTVQVQFSPSAASNSWAIVGGGLLGLTLAHRLAQSGQQVKLFEGASQLGGLASAWSLGDIVWDRHYHVTLLSDTYLRSLLTELELEQEMDWVETRTGFYTDGELYSMSNTLEFLRFPPLRMIDKLRLGATIFYASRVKDWKRLEKTLVSTWLERLSGKCTFKRIWLPLLRAKLGENYRKASAAFIWATIARMYAARRTGLKKEMFGYVPGGYARILERFATVLSEEGVRIELGAEVKKVGPGKAGKVTVELGNGTREAFNQVILTTPSPITATLCPDLSEDERARLEAVQSQGIICASLLLKRSLANFYVTNITDDWVPFTAVIEMSALVDRKHFGGNCLIYLPKYVDPNDSAFSVTDDEWKERFLAALERMYPNFHRSDLLCFRISRVRHVFPIPTMNYSDRLPPIHTSLPGIHILNSAHIVNGTLNVNETVQLAEKTVKELLKMQTFS